MGGRGGSSGLGTGSKQAETIKFSLPQLTGSEKQIAWAEKIRESAINTVNRNIELAREQLEKHPNIELYKETIEAYQEVGRNLKNALENIASASQIINKRDVISPDRLLRMANDIRNKRKKK